MYIDDNYVGDSETFWLEENGFMHPDEAELHSCADGTIVCINGEHPQYNKMTDTHLINTLGWIERKAKEGLTVMHGGGGWDVDSLWYDEDTYYGDEAKYHLNYNIYTKEAKKRKLQWRQY